MGEAQGRDGLSLAALLRGYAEAASRADASPETVAVAVERHQVFLHRAVTARGQKFLVDEPEAFGGSGRAADPAELLLAAVAASLSVAITAHAALREVPVDAITVRSVGEMDAYAFFAPGQGAPGLTAHRLVVEIASPANRETVATLVRDAALASPVLRALGKVPDIHVTHRDQEFDDAV